jgi:hypothetical protein
VAATATRLTRLGRVVTAPFAAECTVALHHHLHPTTTFLGDIVLYATAFTMSKKFKSQASSARAATSAFGGSFGFGSQSTSSLSYVAEQPDLSTISDPNVVVSLRNLSKKDSTTKTKALEEIQDHIKNVVEDGLLSAWVG